MSAWPTLYSRESGICQEGSSYIKLQPRGFLSQPGLKTRPSVSLTSSLQHPRLTAYSIRLMYSWQTIIAHTIFYFKNSNDYTHALCPAQPSPKEANLADETGERKMHLITAEATPGALRSSPFLQALLILWWSVSCTSGLWPCAIKEILMEMNAFIFINLLNLGNT